MRKVHICAPNIWVNSNENLDFAPPVFWPYVIDCAPNLQQVLPPLYNVVKNHLLVIGLVRSFSDGYIVMSSPIGSNPVQL